MDRSASHLQLGDGGGGSRSFLNITDGVQQEEYEHGVDLEREKLDEEFEEEAEVEVEDEEEDLEAEEAPNTLFVPMKVSPPEINRRELLVYMLLLIVFTYNITTQHFQSDFEDRKGVEARLNIVQWNKIKTVDQYIQWYPNLVEGLSFWQENQYNAIEGGVASLNHGTWAPDSGVQTAAVLVGAPVLTQVRCPETLAGEPRPCTYIYPDYFSSARSTKAQKVATGIVIPFDNTDGSDCLWEVSDPSGACYSQVEEHSGRHGYTLPHIHAILNRTLNWSPRLWVDSYTIELGHRFTVFIPSERRFVVSSLKVFLDPSGGVTLGTLDIETHEPFAKGLGFYESPFTGDSYEFVIELIFYAFICYMFVQEVTEIWDCICHSELIVPLQIVTRALRLSLLEVQYFHERSPEVYDPRDPTTGEAFVFPDKADLLEHLKQSVAPLRLKIAKLEANLKKMKRKMAAAPPMRKTDPKYAAFHEKMRSIQVELITTEVKLEGEIFVGEMATMLQLAAMWKNQWHTEFETGYLATLAGQAKRGLRHRQTIKTVRKKDGSGVDMEEFIEIKRFEDVDWVKVARQYIEWTLEFTETSAKGAVDRQSVSSIFVEHLAHEDTDPQHKIFFHLENFINFLDVIRNLIDLHDRMMIAFNIQHWDGPRGVERSNTIERAYQDGIIQYNQTGQAMLQQMAQFPAETQKGFATPNATKAETIRTMAQALHGDLIDLLEMAGLLGFFFPGSPMWETRRRLRAAGFYDQADGFFTSFQNLGWGMVSSTSMDMYMGPAGGSWDSKTDTFIADEDAEQQKEKLRTTMKSSKGSKGGTLRISNPVLAGSPESSSSESDDDTDASPQSGSRSPRQLTKEQLEGMSYDARQMAIEAAKNSAVGNVSPGLPGWRKLITGPIDKRVNYDGQFMTLQTKENQRSRKNQILAYSAVYPLWLWVRMGLKTYLSDLWNAMEMISYLAFLTAFYCKLRMYFGESDDIEFFYNELLTKTAATNRTHPLELEEQNRLEALIATSIFEFASYNNLYMLTLVPNSLVMWVKLFKYFDVIPQMGLLIKVLAAARGPILVFAVMAAMPCMGLALSYHAAFGQLLYRYSTIGKSFNTVLRLSVGDFNFEEIYDLAPLTSLFLFWITAILIVFTLVNIFVAIILKSYEQVVNENPVKKTGVGALSRHSNEQHPDTPDDTKPTIMAERTLSRMDPIEGDSYWDIFDSYFDVATSRETLKDEEEAEKKRQSKEQASSSISKFGLRRHDDKGKGGGDESPTWGRGRSSTKGGSGGGGRHGGGMASRQVSELSRKFERLTKAQAGMEEKVDSIQAQQAEIIRMLKKLS